MATRVNLVKLIGHSYNYIFVFFLCTVIKKFVLSLICSVSLFSFQSKDGTIHQGQVPKPKSDGLLVHIHGGGFVAQSSKSHEVCDLTIFKPLVDCANPVARCLFYTCHMLHTINIILTVFIPLRIHQY